MSDVRAALIASLLISAEADKSDTNDFLAVSAEPLNVVSASMYADDVLLWLLQVLMLLSYLVMYLLLYS